VGFSPQFRGIAQLRGPVELKFAAARQSGRQSVRHRAPKYHKELSERCTSAEGMLQFVQSGDLVAQQKRAQIIGAEAWFFANHFSSNPRVDVIFGPAEVLMLGRI